MRYYPVSKCPTPCYGTSQAEESFSARQDRYKGSLCVTKKFRERNRNHDTPWVRDLTFQSALEHVTHARTCLYIALLYIF